MKRKKLALLGLLVAFCFATLYSTAATMYSNDLVRHVAKLKNKIPDRYTAPIESQIAIFNQAVRHILNSEFASATHQANAIGYTIKAFTHRNNLTYYILESKNAKYRPWGNYIFYLGDDAVDCVIEIPHPVSELNTTDIGINLFIKTKAKAFLLSGSRRSKCDVAFTSGTMFQAAHEEVTTSDTDVIQIHGFNIHKYPQIVITSGTSVAPAGMDKYVQYLIEDFDVGIYNGVQYAELGSTENLQAQYTNSIGANFMGIFLNRAAAQSKRLSNSFIDLMETAISETTTTETSAE